MKTQTITALRLLLVMTILTGIVYPLLMTGMVQIIYPYEANGSLTMKDGQIIGSELIGQKFNDSIYFWSRPSAIDYNPIPSGASNLGPISNTLKKMVSVRRGRFAKMNSFIDTLNIPKEMIFASASGLDPHISKEGALLQVDRICRARKFNIYQKGKLIDMINDLTEPPQYLFLGEERINVLKLNLELDKSDENVIINK
jgi:K+-transporting ATPase ATPase C chain